jgi:hypothetical protein
VNESAIQAHQAREQEKAAEQQAAEEAKGKRGPYAPRKKKTGSVVNGLPTAADPKAEAYRKAGRMMADQLVMVGRTLGGSDWETVLHKDDKGEVLYDERANLREAWADMAEEYQWEKMPAWAACAIATASYIAPRLTAPSTLSRWDKLKLWIASKKAAHEAKNRAKQDKPAQPEDAAK